MPTHRNVKSRRDRTRRTNPRRSRKDGSKRGKKRVNKHGSKRGKKRVNKHGSKRGKKHESKRRRKSKKEKSHRIAGRAGKEASESSDHPIPPPIPPVPVINDTVDPKIIELYLSPHKWFTLYKAYQSEDIWINQIPPEFDIILERSYINMYLNEYPSTIVQKYAFWWGGEIQHVVFDLSKGLHFLVTSSKPHAATGLIIYREGKRLFANELLDEPPPYKKLYYRDPEFTASVKDDVDFIPLDPDAHKIFPIEEQSLSSILRGDMALFEEYNSQGVRKPEEEVRRIRMLRKQKKREKERLEELSLDKYMKKWLKEGKKGKKGTKSRKSRSSSSGTSGTSPDQNEF
jgi:hypothetical protein